MNDINLFSYQPQVANNDGRHITTASGHAAAHTSIKTNAALNKDGTKKRQAEKVARLFAEGRTLTANELQQLTNLKQGSAHRSVNGLRAQNILQINKDDICPISRRTVHHYRMVSDLVQLARTDAAAFKRELERRLNQPVKSLQACIISTLRPEKNAMVGKFGKDVFFVKNGVSTLIDCNEKADIKKQIECQKAGLKYCQPVKFDNFVGMFGLEKL
jgi:hypothetical protein